MVLECLTWIDLKKDSKVVVVSDYQKGNYLSPVEGVSLLNLTYNEFRSYDLSNVEILILDISSANILTEIKRLSHCIVVCFNVKKNLVSHFLIAKVFRLYYQPYIKTKKLKNYRKAVKFIRQRSIELKKLYIHEVNNEVVSVSDSTCIFTNYKYWAPSGQRAKKISFLLNNKLLRFLIKSLWPLELLIIRI